MQFLSRRRPIYGLCWSLLLVGILLVGTGLSPRAARAQGFSVYEQGTCTMALAGAGVAHPCGDGSSIFFSPAGLLDTEGVTISAGATLIATQGAFTSDYTRAETELQNDPIPVPHLYGAWKSTPRIAVGIGVYVPYGLETQWPATWDGAFEGYDNGVESIYIQPTLAYQVTDRIRVGGGPILGIGSVTLNQRIDASQQQVQGGDTDTPDDDVYLADLGVPFHTAFADASLEGSGAIGYGGHVGLTVEATDRIQFGARYMTPVKFEYDGEATFEPVDTGLQLPANNPITGGRSVSLDFILESTFVNGPLVDQSVETELTMPAQFVAGVSVEAMSELQFLLDYHWTGWSSFDTIPLDFEEDALDQKRNEGYENTHAVRIGAAYDLTDAFTLRGGYLFNQAAAPDRTVTPLLPEANRNHLTAGLGWHATDVVEVNVAYQYLGQNDRRGRVRDERVGEEDPSAEDLNSGLYSFNAHLIGTTITIHL
jgi:long-chain fatty acid transport protein